MYANLKFKLKKLQFTVNLWVRQKIVSLCEEIAVANGIFVIDHSQKENPNSNIWIVAYPN